jgi:hypothetical protein
LGKASSRGGIMDFSPEYTEMCEKAKEVQDAYTESEFWDFFYDSIDEKVKQCDDFKGGFVWLPRQDQLQGMLPKTSPLEMLDDIYYCFVCCEENQFDLREYCKRFTSMEQLWLGFVMWKLFSKVWSEHNWK